MAAAATARSPVSPPDATERLRLFVDALEDYALLTVDPNGYILSWNAGAQKIKGWKAEEIVGRHFSCLYTPEDIQSGKPEHGLAIAAANGRYEENGSQLRKDGSRFIAHVIITRIADKNGKLLGFGKITHDITEKIGADVRLRLSEDRLKNLVDTVLDTIVDGVITINRDGEIRSFNKACTQLFGYSLEEALGKNVAMLMPDPHRSGHNGYLKNYHQGAAAKIIGLSREVSGRRKDGSVFPMELSVDGTNRGGEHAYVGIIRDITERKDAEKTREQLRQMQKMEAIGQLTGGIAHDFNNLLAVILGNLDMMREKLPADDPLLSFIDPPIQAAVHGSELTQRLLAFGRNQALQPKTIGLNELITRFAGWVGRTLDERIEIILALDHELALVKIDPGQMEDLLLNLSVNARDAMPQGGKLIFETKNVTIDETYGAVHEIDPGDYVLLAVSDTGTGMSPEVLEKAFEPFFTTKEIGKGNGLGLSMVYGFVRQSAGQVKLYSEAGHGLSVKIYLPQAQGDATKEPARETKLPPVAHQDRRILIVEDNKFVLDLTTAVVKSLGYSAITAENGEDALALLKKRSDIDLLLTDVMLPGKLNGPKLAKRAVALHPKLQVLFNSGYAEHAMFESGLLEEGMHLIGKPFRKHQLAEKIAELLG